MEGNSGEVPLPAGGHQKEKQPHLGRTGEGQMGEGFEDCSCSFLEHHGSCRSPGFLDARSHDHCRWNCPEESKEVHIRIASEEIPVKTAVEVSRQLEIP